LRKPLVLRSPALARPGIVHGCATRIGGVSNPPFSSLNLSDRTGDDPGAVSQNLRLITGIFPGAALVTPDQVHGGAVLVLDDGIDVAAGRLKGSFDAIVTARKNVIIGIKTADCVPILLHDRKTGAVGAVHAGWRGTALGIAREAVEAMRCALGTNPADLTAVIGPAIGACCYRVGSDLESEFGRAFGPGRFVIAEKDGVKTADLRGANRSVLAGAGVLEESIADITLCTSCEKALFFSHRRDGGGTGRQLSFIGSVP
jgi:YfiH family protein